MQQNAHQATTLAITVEDCNLSSEECEAQRVNALTKDDLAILAKNGWLTDNIINAAQALLKQQYPHINGLQNVVLGFTLGYIGQTEEFVQILHTGRGHWVTVSTIGCKDGDINIFDSFPPAPTIHLLNQIAAILATPKPVITLNYINTQQQCGSADCGIFAIAFATTLANGEQPGGLYFDQTRMRKHALDALFGSIISLHLPNCAKKKKGCKSQTVINHTFILFLPWPVCLS